MNRAVKRDLSLILFFALLGLFVPSLLSAAISNQECMSCHEEKSLSRTGPDGKEISLFFDADRFGKSVHGSLQCTNCHDIKEIPHGDASTMHSCASCHQGAGKAFKGSVHKNRASCKECHDYHAVKKARDLRSSLCSNCHSTPAGEFAKGVHAKGIPKDTEAASCWSCHGSHAVLPSRDRKSSTYHHNLPATCGRCHSDPALMQKYGIKAADSYSLFMDSIHGRALNKPAGQASAVCSDCHGSHGIKKTSHPASRTFRTNLARTCGGCHPKESTQFAAGVHGQEVKKGNPAAPTCSECHPAHRIVAVASTNWKLNIIRECGTCHQKLLDSYRDTYHGKVTNLGYVRVAKCADCHGAHNILPASDPASPISPAHRLATCARCHPGANANFAAMIVHADYTDRAKHPHLYFAWRFMSVLLVGVFGFFGIHAVLGLIRGWIARIHRHRRRSPREE